MRSFYWKRPPNWGGQVLIAARASWRRDLIGIVDWRKAELEPFRRKACTLAYMHTPHDVIKLEPDVVILATGGPGLILVGWMERIIA